MSSEVTKPSILWAVDPFQSDFKPDHTAVATLLSWATQLGYAIKPVYVVSKPGESLEVMTDEEKSDLMNRVIQKIQRYLSGLGVSGVKKTRVLLSDSRRIKLLGKELADYAKKIHSPLIVVSSHGHTGLNRAFFGSFAESTLRYSEAPVFFLSHCQLPELPTDEMSSRILFPTDFSPEAHRAFRKLLKLEKPGQTRISLFYANVWPTMATGIEVPIVLTPDFLEQQEVQARAVADKWAAEAKSLGFSVDIVCSDPVSPYDIAPAILKASKEARAGLICLSCTSGQLSALLNGSVSRDVFRKSECPVLVFGPAALEVSEEIKAPNEMATV